MMATSYLASLLLHCSVAAHVELWPFMGSEVGIAI